ncbi:MAG: hypothetical protein IJY42_06170 [Clostridia bacterium]|nr:hypothetical protein [Clostridia bacterium]
MQIDRASLEKLLSLNDMQFKAIVTKLVRESGIDPAELNLDTSNLSTLRQTLGRISDEDLARIAEQFDPARKPR